MAAKEDEREFWRIGAVRSWVVNMANCSPNKIKKMWAVARVLGLTEDILRDIVEAVSGQRRISKLNDLDANKVLDRLDDLMNQDAGLLVRGMAKPREIGKLYKLMYLLGWQKYQLRGFIRKMTAQKKSHEKELTNREIYRIIEGLKGMCRRLGIPLNPPLICKPILESKDKNEK